jgi:hypothetical protein
MTRTARELDAARPADKEGATAVATRDELNIPMPSMAPSYRVAPSRTAAMDPATRRLATFAGVIGGALLLLVAVWSFTGHRHTGVPVVEAPSGPLRVKPANPGGLQVDGANDAILSGGSDGKESAAPPPETPAPQALKAAEQAAQAAAAAPQPPAQPATAPAPRAAPATVRAELQPLPQLRPHITVVAPKPMPQTAAATPVPPPVTHEPSAPLATPAAGAPLVQLAAVESEQAAMSEWQRLSRKYPELLGGRRPTITKIEHGGRTYWRVRTAGFSDVSQAAVFCEHIKQKGGGCSIASF